MADKEVDRGELAIVGGEDQRRDSAGVPQVDTHPVVYQSLEQVDATLPGRIEIQLFHPFGRKGSGVLRFLRYRTCGRQLSDDHPQCCRSHHTLQHQSLLSLRRGKGRKGLVLRPPFEWRCCPYLSTIA